MKEHLQKFLDKIGIYQRMKASIMYDLYWRVSDPRVIECREKEVLFYRQLLGDGFKKGDLIFDIGANQGTKTGVFLALGARVIAVEPDEFNKKVLQEKFLRKRLIKKPVTIVSKAVSSENGIQTIWIDEPGSAENTLNPKWVEILRNDEGRLGKKFEFRHQCSVETITLEKLIDEFGLPSFIKIDVEGFELEVLRGLRRPVQCLSFEVNLPEFREEGLECVRLLEDLSPRGIYNYTADLSQGFILSEWLPQQQFLTVFKSCNESSIEVFWKPQELMQKTLHV